MLASSTYETVGSIYLIRCEILFFQTRPTCRSIPTFLCRRQESPSTVRVKIQWTGAIERTMAYISFFLTLRRLEIWHDSSISILPIMRHGSRFNISHLFFLGVLSSPESHVDPFLFNVVLCTYWVRT